jgi:hypothetical protein
MLLISVFFVSLATLAFEVLLTRVFSIGQWNHLSFMVISIALFGFAASGTFLSLVEARMNMIEAHHASKALVGIIVCLYSLSAVISFLALNHLPLDYFRLPVQPVQCLYLLAAYLLLALPFFFSGLIISLAYTTSPEKTGLVYFSSMAGSACGAILPVPLLPLMGEGRLIVISTLIPLIAAVLSTFTPFGKAGSNTPEKWFGRIAVLICSLGNILLAAFLLTSAGVSLIQVKPSPYKALSQVLRFPQSQIVETKTGITGRIDRTKTPYIRFAPGLSLKYHDELPQQHAVFTDGDNQIVLYDIAKKNDARFAKSMLSYSGYHLIKNPKNILLIQHGGGSAIPCAMVSDARHISIIQQNHNLAAMLRRQYPFQVISQNPRKFLAQTGERYDIIHLENWGTSIPGAAALNQDHLLTIDAFAEYFSRLDSNGVIIISRKLLLPPSDSLRLWSTAYEALKRMGVESPEMHLSILRNWDTFTLLVSKSLIAAQSIIDYARYLNFDLVFLNSISQEMVNKFNVFDEPYHYKEINQLAAAYQSGNEKDFFRMYPLDIEPQTDRRPFPGRLLKWSKLKMLYHSLGSRLYALLMSGEIVIVVVFFEALIVALFLLIIPMVLSTRGIQKPALSQVVYFFAVGAGFMFAEIYFIKRFIILVGDPVVSFTLVVAGILIFSCLGGLWVQKKNRCNIRLTLVALISALVLEAAGFELMVNYIQKLSTGLRFLIAFLFLLPAGFLMGLPFPFGMRYILDTPVQRAYAWSVNGCASVLTSIAAAQIAISHGIPHVIAFAVFAYFLAVLVVTE